MADYVLTDTAVIIFANAMRIQSMVGNTALIIDDRQRRRRTLPARQTGS